MTPPSPQPDIEAAVAAVERLDRRTFLKFAALGAGLAAGGMLPGVVQAALPKGVRFMDESEVRVFQRLAEVSLPVKGTRFLALNKVPLIQTLDGALLAGMEPHILQGLKGGVKYFEDGPRIQYGKPFSKLSACQAEAFCDLWANSANPDQRGLVTALKKLVTLAYWANPPTWAALGYDGPVSDRWGLKSIGNAPLPE